jgi:ferredoxin
MKIRADRETCIGAGMCVLTAPAVFDQDDGDGRVLVAHVEPDASQYAEVREAASLCPSGAIAIDED